MAKLIIHNLTLEQAQTLAEWFEGQGEQDCIPWFEENDVDPPTVNVQRKPFMEVDEEDEVVTLYCKSEDEDEDDDLDDEEEEDFDALSLED